MNEERYSELMIKLSKVIEDNGSCPFVSPKSKSSGESRGTVSPEAFLITKTLKVKELTKEKLLFVHTLLHKLFSNGSKFITKQEIKELHKEITKNINHFYFDKLDND